jgi:hypothetical protein
VVVVEWSNQHSLTLYDAQHDVQLDYYGKRLATCSSDRQIKVCSHLLCPQYPRALQQRIGLGWF